MNRKNVKFSFGLFLAVVISNLANAQAVDPSHYAPCRTQAACSIGPGGGRSMGPGGGLSMGPGGGLSMGPGGGLFMGPGGGLSMGPGGGLSAGGPYRGPWTPCLTGVMGVKWNRDNCPGLSD